MFSDRINLSWSVMFGGEKIFFSERGRRSLGGRSSYVYFEVLVPLPEVNSLEFFALDDRGVVLGSGSHYQSEGYREGYLFEVFFSSTPPDLITRWQCQDKSYGQRSPRTFMIEMLSRERWEREGSRVDYIRASASLVAATNRLPKFKNGWTGPVVWSTRSEIFHHPECPKAKSIKDAYRREYAHAQTPWEEGLSPCQDCLFCLQ